MAYEGLCRLCLVKYDKYRNLMATKSEIYSQELIQKIEELFNLQVVFFSVPMIMTLKLEHFFLIDQTVFFLLYWFLESRW